MNTMFDSCSNNEEITQLKRKIASLERQLAVQREINQKTSGANLLRAGQKDLYPGEQLDFLISVLKQIQVRCPQDSRAFDIIESLLEENRPAGIGLEILKTVERILKKGLPSSASDIASLTSIGFSYTPSRKHPKLRFHEKYMVVLPGTTGDRQRSNKNAMTEISKCIAISQKV